MANGTSQLPPPSLPKTYLDALIDCSHLISNPGRKKIQSIATGLRLPDRLSDSAQRYFNLAVNMKFVQGRRTTYVVAAVLYCACRMDKTSHMLIDFSDLLEVSGGNLLATFFTLQA